MSPQAAAAEFGESAIFIIAIWNPYHSYQQTKKQLLELGCTQVTWFYQLDAACFPSRLPYYCIDNPDSMYADKEDILKCAELWYDEQSRQEYIAHLRWRRSPDEVYAPTPVTGDLYFLEDLFSLQAEDTFIDGGAFDGDTILSLLGQPNGHIKEVLAFEPDPSNYSKLVSIVDGLDSHVKERIVCYNLALSNTAGVERFMATGQGSSSVSQSGTIEVDCAKLDEILVNKKPTIMKFDIEGAELAALAGAQEIIRKYKPILAVSVYHKQNDLWRIPLFINELNPGYNLFLRSHYHDGLDTVCYAIPTDRLINKIDS